MDLVKFPYDVQNISTTITSWAHTTEEIFLFPMTDDPADSIFEAEYHFRDDIAWDI